MTDLLIADFKGGCRCIDCDKPILNGDPYSRRLVAIDTEMPVLHVDMEDGIVYNHEIVCWLCGQKEITR